MPPALRPSDTCSGASASALTYVRLASQRIRGSGVEVSAVVSFPHGHSATAVKVAEARRAVDDGAQEIGTVSNIGALKSRDDKLFAADVGEISALCRREGVRFKVTLGRRYLDDGEKVRGALLAERAGADFVKTPAGFGSRGATREDVALPRRTVPGRVRVKATGGSGPWRMPSRRSTQARTGSGPARGRRSWNRSARARTRAPCLSDRRWSPAGASSC